MSDFATRLETHSPENPYPGASEYDSDQTMTPEEIVAMKQELAGDTRRVNALVSWIVTDMLMKSYEDDAENRSNPNGIYASTVPQDLDGRVNQASWLGADWALKLMTACQLPGDEWPEHMTSPGNFAAWLQDMDSADAQENEAATNEPPSIDEKAASTAEHLESIAPHLASLIFASNEQVSMRLQRVVGSIAQTSASIRRSQQAEYGLD